MDQIVFRKAYESELPDLIHLQSLIFYEEQGIPMDLIGDFMKRKPTFWCAMDNDVCVATAASWKEDGITHWGRFTVKKEYRRKHIGKKLACLSFDEIFESGEKTIYMEARDTTKAMVEKLGGEVIGESELFFGLNVTPLILKKENYHKQA